MKISVKLLSQNAFFFKLVIKLPFAYSF